MIATGDAYVSFLLPLHHNPTLFGDLFFDLLLHRTAGLHLHLLSSPYYAHDVCMNLVQPFYWFLYPYTLLTRSNLPPSATLNLVPLLVHPSPLGPCHVCLGVKMS